MKKTTTFTDTELLEIHSAICKKALEKGQQQDVDAAEMLLRLANKIWRAYEFANGRHY